MSEKYNTALIDTQDALSAIHDADGMKVMTLNVSKTAKETATATERNCLKPGSSQMLRCVRFVFTRGVLSRLPPKTINNWNAADLPPLPANYMRADISIHRFTRSRRKH